MDEGNEAASLTATGDCSVCCRPYTSSTRRPVHCPSCKYEACVPCVKAYLLSTLKDASCMNCGHHFNRAFLDDNFSASWRGGAFKKHRQTVLFDRERALIPATQPAVERKAIRNRLEEAKAKAYRAVAEARRKLNEVKAEHSNALTELYKFCNTKVPPEERRTFVAACPTDCKGFLSNFYKCGTCLKTFCSSCREEKLAGHTCDPETVATIKAILQDSKACPGCGMSINRVSGCDQMYCTLCDVAFSYKTGQKVTGVIHNPHYFDRLRQLSREDECGWPSLSFMAYLEEPCARFLRSVHRTATNIQNAYLADGALTAFQRRGADNQDLRVDFCLGVLSETAFKSKLEQRESKRDLEVDLREVLEVFVLLSMEVMYRVREESMATRDRSFREETASGAHEALLAFQRSVEDLVNAPLRSICSRYRKPLALVEMPPELEWKTLHRHRDLFHESWIGRIRAR